MSNRFLVAVSTLACALMLAACGGGDDNDAVGAGPVEPSGSGSGSAARNTQTVDACTLLDRKDVESAIGEPIEKVEGQGTPDGAGTCSWYGRDTGSLLQKGVTLIAARDNGRERWNNHKQVAAGQVRPEPDFGDEAFTDGQIIAGYKGNSFVVISPLYKDAGVTPAQVKPLGKRVLDSLS